MSTTFSNLGNATYCNAEKTFYLTTATTSSSGALYTDQNPSLNFLTNAWYFTPPNSNTNFGYNFYVGDSNSNIQFQFTNSNFKVVLGTSNYSSNVNTITRYSSSNNVLANVLNGKLYIKYNTSNLYVLSNNIPQSYDTSAYLQISSSNIPQSSNFVHKVKNLFLKNTFGFENNTIFNSNVNILGNLTTTNITACNINVLADITTTCNLSVGRILSTNAGNNRISFSGYGDVISRGVNVWGAGDRYGMAMDNYGTIRLFTSGAYPNSGIALSKATDDWLDGANAGFFDFIKIKGSNGYMDIQSNVGINTTSTSSYSLKVGGDAYITNKITCYETSASVITTLNATSRSLKLPKGGTIGFPGYPTIEFNYDDTGKQTDAGKITYAQFTSSNALELVGGGNTINGRFVKIYDNLSVGNTNDLAGSGTTLRVEGGVLFNGCTSFYMYPDVFNTMCKFYMNTVSAANTGSEIQFVNSGHFIACTDTQGYGGGPNAAGSGHQIFIKTGGLSINAPVKTNGNITCVSLTQTSDRKLKTNIQPIENALDKVCQIKGYTYTPLQKDMNKIVDRCYGVIAQEVLDITPEVIVNSEDTYYVAYSEIVPLLIESIKELKKEIDLLKNTNNII